RTVSLADGRPDAGWSRPGGNDARTAHHGAAICRFPGWLEPAGKFVAAALRVPRRIHHNLDDVRPLFRLDFPWRASRRTAARQDHLDGRPFRRDRGGCWGDLESGGLVRAARDLAG